ncbi:hypothetical protein AY600_20085 [Phormidium willei BDU 130791]|nr:hypothetical protein AY600_20085 [Phormidium willei BDU 130791]
MRALKPRLLAGLVPALLLLLSAAPSAAQETAGGATASATAPPQQPSRAKEILRLQWNSRPALPEALSQGPTGEEASEIYEADIESPELDVSTSSERN